MAIKKALQLNSGLVVKNRLVKSAMTEGLGDAFGKPTAELAKLYEEWAESDCGILITGNIQVDRRFLERPGNVAIDLDHGEYSKEDMEKLTAVVKAGQKHGAKMIAQISHGGRQSSSLVCKVALAPSNVRSRAPDTPEVEQATEEEIGRIIEKFVYASKVCEKAGFDGVQIHSAHGYFLSSMLTPYANTRSDQYGGNLENRSRALLKIIAQVKEETNNMFCVSVKLNASDFKENGLTPEESLQVALMLSDANVDLLELSGGSYEKMVVFSGTEMKNEKPDSKEAYFLPFAAKIKDALNDRNSEMKLMVTGGFRFKETMNKAIEQGKTDFIGVGRPLCVQPRCTARLLKSEINSLPQAEAFWKLPLGLEWFESEFLSKMKQGGILMAMMNNLHKIGSGEFINEQTNSRYPNLLWNLFSRMNLERTKAKALRGYKKDARFLTKRVLKNVT